MSRIIDNHRCSPTHLNDEVQTWVGLFSHPGLVRKILVALGSILVFAVGSYLGNPVEAGCGLYHHHGSDVRLIRTSEILNNPNMGTITYRQFFELMQGQWGPPEPVCSGPNCGRPESPFPSNDLASDLIPRTNFGVACGNSGERLRCFIDSARMVLTDSCHCLDGFLSSIEHPPKLV